ncbi:hypothetical protein BDU57DRAFT_524930 [Ampelomyces quisqualis]|uniref:Uncharacterized protein n=1 Tax=Ampelomyces quisqualis TaxID=50730 RepID=A0A6A5QA40_AMPQU|nr:hypothetical protein BDU57DRAFT_524930 [Ampelomyces quisqualis]
MALRGRTPTTSDDTMRNYDSSPDPLAMSFDENRPKSTRKSSPRKALVPTSPSKQNRRSSISEFEFSSPSKAMIMNTPRVGSASPWRIKVTVQAEPGSDEETSQSPTVERITRTQTTTIPLKDPDAPSPVKRGRGRPRKSDVGATPKSKRAGTPVKRAARAKSRDGSVGAADASAADVDTDAPPKRRRGRPKKSVEPPTDEDVIMAHIPQDDDRPSIGLTPVPATKSKPASSQKSTRFATPQGPMPDIQTTDATPQPPPSMLPQDKVQNGTRLMLPADRRRRSFKAMPEYELPVVDTPPPTDLGRRLKARKSTPHAKKVVPVVISSDEDSDHDSDVLTPTSGEDDHSANEPMRDPFTSGTVAEEIPDATSQQQNNASSSQTEANISILRQDSCSEQPFEDDDEGFQDEELQDATNFAFDEGATRMPDDTTVLDSENFSMISVDSLPSSGGLTSPPQPAERSIPAAHSGSLLQHKCLQPSMSTLAGMHAQDSANVSSESAHVLPDMKPSRPAFRRYVTPVIDAAVPSVPPIREPIPPAPPKNETPRLGRVVTAGVALQGVLDPARLTPEPSRKTLDEKRDSLDNLFRGFSDRTRKDLQAGLRLGEQLAQGQTQEQASPRLSSPSKPQPHPEAAPKAGVFRTHRKHRESRLLTPEDQDFVITQTAEPEAQDIQYPALNTTTETSLPSPTGSADEMSWRVDTPPAHTNNTERMEAVIINNQAREINNDTSNSAGAYAESHAKQEGYSDIWQEEASRSSSSAEAGSAPQLQELFEPGIVPPARGKLPRTWRRRSGNHFQYSDEAESPQQPIVAHPEAVEERHEETDQNEGEAEEEEDDTSDGSDDTGMFFQSNMPSIFGNRHSRDRKQRKAEKLDLSLLLKDGESLVPESSPPVATKISKNIPFLSTPRFPGFPSSPHKSSPLRVELRGSDISSEAQSHFLEESSLPLAQSSPFRTFVDGESNLSVASDQRQLQMEMEGVTDSSICRVREEANGYLNAYEPQERSLDEIEEVTEPSRTWHRNTSMVASSPPRMKMLSPVRKRVPLFRDTPEKPRATPFKLSDVEATSEVKASKQDAPSSTPNVADQSSETSQEQRPTGLLTRMTSSLWSVVSKPVAPVAPAKSAPAPHPILAKLTPLPKIEPWTKTHYKTLDKLYSVNQKHPALFSPSITPATSLSQTNTHLFNKFLANKNEPYVGAVFSAWGYEFDMTEELVVLCQVFCELMTLDNIKAYETLKGREIEMGDCMPGTAGDPIEAEEVMRRLATIILGEEVRYDEKAGVEIDRTQGLEVHWPQ